MNTKIILVLISSLIFSSCINSTRFQSSRVNTGKQVRVNSSYTSIKGNEPLVIESHVGFDLDENGDHTNDTIYRETDTFEYSSVSFAPTFSSVFISEKLQISGVLLPFLVVNYGEAFIKYQLVDVGDNGLFSNLSLSPFVGGNLFLLGLDAFSEATIGFSTGTFKRKNRHEIEVASNFIFSESRLNSHVEDDYKYQSLLLGLGSAYTYWKEEPDNYFSVELGLFYNYLLSKTDKYYINDELRDLTVDRKDITAQGFPFTLSLSLVNSF